MIVHRTAILTGLGLLALWFVGCRATPVSTPADVKLVSISAARAIAPGSDARVRGAVTVPSGAFASSMPTGFALQDGTGGIYVLDEEHELQIGDVVEVIGRTGMEHEMTHIRLGWLSKLPTPRNVPPRSVKTGELGEASAGFLVRAEGRLVRAVDDAPYGYKLWVDDGSGECRVFIDTSTGLVDVAASWRPGESIRAVGFVGRYRDAYEIMPRIRSDLTKRQ